MVVCFSFFLFVISNNKKIMHASEVYVTPSSSQQTNICKYVLIIISIVLGLSCLAGFVFVSIQFKTNSYLESSCHENQTDNVILCFLRSIISTGMHTQWNRLIMINLLLTYASVFHHIIVETNRTNVRGPLGLMILQTACIIFGIGFSFPSLYISSFIYFYQLKRSSTKSSVPIDTILLGFIYVFVVITIPTYLIYFCSKTELIVTIMSIVLLASPLAFIIISFPFRFCSKYLLHCWRINSHRLILLCQLILFITSSPLYFIALVAFIQHFSIDLWKNSYVTDIHNQINPIALIWSIDFCSLFLSLIIYIIINEYLFTHTNDQYRYSRIKACIVYILFALFFLSMPCLIFPLYVAWKEYEYLRQA